MTTQLENNRKNALGFFGANLFCEAGCNAALFQAEGNSKNADGNLMLSPSILADIHEGTFNYSDFYLKQRHISKISEDEAFQIANLWTGGADSSTSEYGYSVLETLRGIEGRLPSEITDYLRSIGIAIPWMGLAVEEQIEYGWIRLTKRKLNNGS
jgi:hypothetical protein